MAACLGRDGLHPPAGRPSAPPTSVAALLREGVYVRPATMSIVQYTGALRRCSALVGTFEPHGDPPDADGEAPPGLGPRGAALKHDLAAYETCMLAHGVHLPAANTSRPGLLYDFRRVDAAAPTFRAAQSSCRARFTALFRARDNLQPLG
jgi:hypothetical protein